MTSFRELLAIGFIRKLFGQLYQNIETGDMFYQLPYAIAISGFVLILLIAYMLGSLNFAVIISKVKYKDDIRNHGSGNAGMTNMMRTYGTLPAVLTLLGDAAKAIVAVTIGALLLGHDGAFVGGLGCIIGHTFPVYYGFKGGKGVVTSITLIMCTSPLTGIILLGLFVIIVAFTKYISLGSIMCALIYPLLLSRLTRVGFVETVCSIIIAIFIVYTHRENIKRLYAGKENKFSFKKTVKKDEDQNKKTD